MSPIDDELRAALQGRAQVLAPSPDPLAGIERRAQRIRRNRVAASVAGSALAVAAIATVVPALQSATTSAPREAQFATTPPSAEPSALVEQRAYALDPDAPWAFRGRPVEEGTRATIEREYAARTGTTDVRLVPLFAQVYEPSQQLEVVFVAQVGDEARWGVAQSSEAGPEFLWDEPLVDGAESLAAALPGDEGVARLLVVAAPEAESLGYGPDDASEFAPLAAVEPGIGTIALEGDPGTDSYRVGYDGRFVVAAAPDLADGPTSPDAGPPAAAAPANLLDWPARGTALPADLEARVLELFQAGLESADGEPLDTGVTYRPLFTSDTDGGVRFTVGQAWATGREAHTVALAVGGTSGEQFLLGPVTPADTQVVAQLVCCEPGSTVDTLVVVPVPGTGQVLYDDDDSGRLRPVGESQDYLDGVVLVDRDPKADRDRLQLLDGDGDLDRPLFEGPVSSLLCGVKECG